MQYCSNLARNNEGKMEEEVVSIKVDLGNIEEYINFLEDEENAELFDEMAKAYEEELYKETSDVKYLENQNKKLSNLVFKIINDIEDMSEKAKELNDKMDSIEL